MTEDTIPSRIRSIAEAFTVSGLARLRLKDAGLEVELRRSLPPAAPQIAAPPSDTGTSAETPLAIAAKPDIVTSDLVGVLRFSRPYVNEGHLLEADRELAFVEALGIRNPVRSRGPGTVAAIFVNDGQPVEYGQPLFAIER